MLLFVQTKTVIASSLAVANREVCAQLGGLKFMSAPKD